MYQKSQCITPNVYNVVKSKFKNYHVLSNQEFLEDTLDLHIIYRNFENELCV